VIFRVKEHLRRGDNSIGPDEEDAFHRIVSFCLKYYRLKVEHEQLQTDESALGEPWVPRLQVIMQTLDRMSFHRVTHGIKTALESKKHDSVWIVMEAYSEMLSYLQILLSSTDTCHHELAAAALFGIFFRSSDRLDPLPQLLRDWKPSLFGRRHLNSLLELCHQTLKVLDKAKSVFKDSDHYSNKSVRKGKKKAQDSVSDNYEVALEQYVAAVIQFDAGEYLKRLVSNHSVRMYTRVLEKYESNSPQTNHYIFVFFHRLLAFKLDMGAVLDQDIQEHCASEEKHPTLGHLLFNIHTLTVFDTILQNTGFIAANKYLQPLVELIRSVVRRFFLLAQRNHLLFVDVLLQHPHAIDFIEKLDNVYDASAFGRGQEPSVDIVTISRRYIDEDDEEGDIETGGGDEVRLNTSLGDEFDEMDLPAAFARKEKVKRPRDKERDKAAKRLRRDRGTWSAEEDAVLREQFHIYKGSRSIFETIAFCGELRCSHLSTRVLLCS
jgi:timeless